MSCHGITRQINGIIWIFLCFISVTVSDLCFDPDSISPKEMRQMQSNIFPSAVPQGAMNAGVFDHDINAKDIATCLLSCCDWPLCNVAWYTHNKCFTIQCKDKGVCEPVTMTDAEFNDTMLIQVRSLDETSETKECDMETNAGCSDHQTCHLTETIVTRCQCDVGYVHKSQQTRDCIPASSHGTKEQAPQRQAQYKTCEYGLHQCGEDEVCFVPEGSRKVGTCRCRDGYQENEGVCVPKNMDMTKKTSKKQTSVFGHRTTKTLERTSKSEETIESTTTSTTTKPPPTTPKVELLMVSAGDDKEMQLPDDEVALKAFVVPKEADDDPYHYDWALVSHPEGSETGSMDGKNTDTLKLSKLIAGHYTFKVQVTGKNKFGAAIVNVTVNPPARVNVPPVAVTKPSSLVLNLPNSAILDGSDSRDDDKIVAYHWEEVSGPLRDDKITGDSSILTLKDLTPGNYTFKLTVTDSDGATNATTANVTAIKEVDYAPKANAGSDQVIHLPVNSVILYGNLSTDDKGIVSYEWIHVTDDKLAVGMQGVRTSELQLSNLEVGYYTFTLKVTDGASQVSTADVHVDVRPEENRPPVARVKGPLEEALPLDVLMLDGSASSDDRAITSYLWQQTGGPTILTLKDADKNISTVRGEFKVDLYTFKLTVKDADGLTSSTTLTVNIKKVDNEPPVARAGGDVVVQLPQVLVALDGSQSSDDYKITNYHWVRDQKSLAAGDVLNGSDHQAILQLVNLVAGRYVFKLSVIDSEGLSSTDTAALDVKEDVHKKDLLELIVDADLTKFTQEDKSNLAGQLGLLLPKSTDQGDTVIQILGMEEDESSGNLRVTFYAMSVQKDFKVYRSGMETLAVLRTKLMSQPYVLDFKVVAIDTVVCQNNCSDHGRCNAKTRKCICEAFWTQDIFLYSVHGQSNCDWSILYVVLVSFIILVTLAGSIWGCICFWRRRRCRCRLRAKKRHRYSLLQDIEEDLDTIELKKRKSPQKSSVMISDSDFSSDEETIFVNHKKSNGHLPRLNGINKQHLKTLKT